MYDFRLRDQHDQMIRLSGLRGKAVALTFLYANCPDICPLIANKMHEAYQQLGAAAPRVALLAVSVDPNGDTPQAVQRFLTGHRVEGELHYLTGSFADLRPVWAHYYIGSDAKEVNPQAAAASAPPPGPVGHTAIVYLLDPGGNLRVFLPGNFDPKDLATDLKILGAGAH
jgi:protein SCO1/2